MGNWHTHNNNEELVDYQLEVKGQGHKITIKGYKGSTIAVKIIKLCLLIRIIELR